MIVKLNGNKLKAIRKQKKLTQEKFAEQIDASARYVRDLESGRKSNPSATLLCQMSKALDVPMDELMETIST